MKNIKLLFVSLVIFAAFGFTLITTGNDVEKIGPETEVASVEIENRFSDDPDAFN